MAPAHSRITKDQILELAAKLWRPPEIAAFFNVSLSTVYSHVTAAELIAAQSRGTGRLLDLAWEKASGPKGDRILLHMLQYHREEVVQLRAKLIDATNAELYEEVQRRIAAAKTIGTGSDLKTALLAAPDPARAEPKQSEATDAENASGGDGKPGDGKIPKP